MSSGSITCSGTIPGLLGDMACGNTLYYPDDADPFLEALKYDWTVRFNAFANKKECRCRGCTERHNAHIHAQMQAAL